MRRMKGNIPDIHNIGLVDRTIRFAIGGVLFSAGALSEVLTFWETVSMIVALYPLLTSVIGWDPVYQFAEYRSGRNSGHNVTGTLPYQIDAALGHNPIPDAGYSYDHSLTGSHQEPVMRKAA